MSTKETGGPAFPVLIKPTAQAIHFGVKEAQMPGMTLRDYFAAKAMQASLAAMINEEFAMTDGFDTAISKMAYLMADLMLAERAK